MKKIILSILFVITGSSLFAQITSIGENFDVKCVLSTNFPNGWLKYNPVSTVDSASWMCTPTLGRPNLSGAPTPGMRVSGVYNNNYHLDTAYLVTPLLNLTGYTGNLYLRFDTKTSKINLGSTLSLLVFHDTSAFNAYAPSVDLTSTVTPVFSGNDSTDWVTHQVDLTGLKASTTYIAFRYVSKVTNGSIWYLDNVNTSTTRLGVQEMKSFDLPLTVLGNGSPEGTVLAFQSDLGGMYQVSLYDMMGRMVLKKEIIAVSGENRFDLGGLWLSTGLYIIKVGDGSQFGTARVVLRQ